MPSERTPRRRPKATLLRLLSGLSRDQLTPGKRCALGIAVNLVKRAKIAEIERAAKGVENAEIFWGRQWDGD